MKSTKPLALVIGLIGLVALPATAAQIDPADTGKVPVQRDFDHSMRSFRDDMNRMFREFFDHSEMPAWDVNVGSSPAADVIDQDNVYTVRIEAPGMKPETIDLSVTGNTILLKGEKRQDQEFKNESYIRREMSYGSFSRTVTLPNDADMDKADATYRDGVLTVSVPKNPAVAPKWRKLSVKP